MSSIRERLAELRQAQKKSAPSFAPGPRKTKPVEVLPDVTELIPASEMSTLVELVQMHLEYGRAESVAKKAKKPVTLALKTLCSDYGVTKALCQGVRITYYPMTRETISMELLLEAGVSLATIKACTIKTDSYAVRISPPGEEEDDVDTE